MLPASPDPPFSVTSSYLLTAVTMACPNRGERGNKHLWAQTWDVKAALALQKKMQKCLSSQNLTSAFTTWPMLKKCPFAKGGDTVPFILFEPGSSRQVQLISRQAHSFIIVLQV